VSCCIRIAPNLLAILRETERERERERERKKRKIDRQIR
jgi:hypothetical protein